MSEQKKDLKDTEPWTSVVLATRALTNPQGNEIFTLTELNEAEIRYGVQALILADAFKTDLLKNVVVNLAILKRSRDRKGESSVIKLVRNASMKMMQNVQMSRFKRVMSNRDDYTDYDKD
ncbi:hypothetical protein [Nitrososphaera sp.]|uniref:hypothetical protein n=1 Tax=Nitrososphaera sp. TaxID=1971748 RepID=UPI0017D1853C|nr:hypothetical protein [Nitrososphaera sp.]NWG36683.1 hypothetical protein [Nitrososphaera sp.]